MRTCFYLLFGLALQLPTSGLNAQLPDRPSANHEPVQINIERDYGCKSIDQAPGFDNSRLLNQCFQDASGRDFSYIYFPGKAYRINDTVRIPPGTSMAVMGTGASLFQAHWQYHPRPNGRGPAPFGGPASRLVWFGPQDRPMVVHAGERLYWLGVSLFGRFAERDWRSPEGQKAAIGLLVTGSPENGGAGGLEAPVLSVAECVTGVEFAGDEPGDSMPATTFGFLLTHKCDVGLRTRGHIRREIAVQLYWPYFTDIALRFENGGHLNCRSLGLMAPGTILSLGKTDVVGSSYQVNGLIVDNNATDWDKFYLVRMDDRAEATITMSGHLPHADYDYPIAWLSGAASLTLRDLYGLREGAVVCRTASAESVDGGPTHADVPGPQVFLDACRMHGSAKPWRVVDRAQSDQNWFLRWTGCFNYFAEPSLDGTASGQSPPPP